MSYPHDTQHREAVPTSTSVAGAKRPYRPPTLKAIGSVRELTAKAGSVSDDFSVTGPTRKGT